MNNVKIRVECSSFKFINYLVNNNISYFDLKKDDCFYMLVTSYDNYLKIRRRYNTLIIRYYGNKFLFNIINNNKYLLMSFFVCMLFLYLLCNTIYDIEINCESDLRNKIVNVLKKYDISKYKKIKAYKELTLIKENILQEIPEIEWLEITRDGVKYIVDVNPKINNINSDDNGFSNIIASMDGVIKHIVVHNGDKIKEENEFVKKGELIISGNLFKDGNLIDSVNAKGSVYAEVWYLAKIEVPLILNEKTINKTINHYYLDFNGKKFSLTGVYKKDGLISNNKCLLNKPYLPFKLYKESLIEYKNYDKYLSYDEALDYGVKLGEEKIQKMLDEHEYIISKNVLKNRLKSSKMYIEVFFKVYKNIASTSYVNEKEIIDEEYNS